MKMNYKNMKKSELIALVQELTTPKYRVTGSYNIGKKLIEDIGCLNQEHFMLVVLDNNNEILEEKILNIGNVNSSIVNLAEFARTILRHSTGVNFITAHNHPSGSLIPSNEDDQIRNKILKIAELFKFNYLDDMIITRNEYWSAKEAEIIK